MENQDKEKQIKEFLNLYVDNYRENKLDYNGLKKAIKEILVAGDSNLLFALIKTEVHGEILRNILISIINTVKNELEKERIVSFGKRLLSSKTREDLYSFTSRFSLSQLESFKNKSGLLSDKDPKEQKLRDVILNAYRMVVPDKIKDIYETILNISRFMSDGKYDEAFAYICVHGLDYKDNVTALEMLHRSELIENYIRSGRKVSDIDRESILPFTFDEKRLMKMIIGESSEVMGKAAVYATEKFNSVRSEEPLMEFLTLAASIDKKTLSSIKHFAKLYQPTIDADIIESAMIVSFEDDEEKPQEKAI